jgi:peptidoglycan/LPS O-acetylase OafA/YrhL
MTIAPPDQVRPVSTTPARRRPLGRLVTRRPVPRRPDPVPPRRTAAAPGFRPELQGLRAVAVALVVGYHVWFGRVSGGVDVFFLITGFLLVGRLAKAAAAGPLPLGRMWTRNLGRLLPAAAVVLLCTLAIASAVLPAGRLPQTLREVVAAQLFMENWQLAADAVDYTARSNTNSVVQHFWSLSIQGQILLTFPLLVALIATAGRGPRLRVRLAVLLGGLSAASLTFSVVLTTADQPLAYFHTLTRLWEFGLGGLLALGIGRIALPARVRAVLGWVGVLGLIACGAVLPVSSVFPGVAALWPTGCAALVLIAGTTRVGWAVDRLLGTRPLQYLGDLSYALYLWHWPLLMFVLVATGSRQAGVLAGLGVVATSLVLAVATHHLVERPSGIRIGVVGLVTLLAVTITWSGLLAATATPPGLRDERHPGALALAGTVPPVPGVAALPSAVSVYRDWVHTERWDCAPLVGTDTVCRQPTAAPPQRHIVVVGDSHAQQFLGALLPLTGRHGWQITSMLRGGCPFTATGPDTTCREWNDAALAEIERLRPDAVVTVGTRNVSAGLTEDVPSGFITQWERLDDQGIPVVAIRDNPRFAAPPPDCLQRRGREDPTCGIPRAAVYSAPAPWTRTAVPANVGFVDIADLVCGPVMCPAEVGNVIVYMDDNHLSGTYAATMAPLLEGPFREALGW